MAAVAPAAVPASIAGVDRRDRGLRHGIARVARRTLHASRQALARIACPRRAASNSIIGRSGRLSYLLGRLCDRLPGVHYARHLLVAMPTDGIPAMPRGYDTRAVSPQELARHRIDAGREVQAARHAAGMVCISVFDRHQALLGVTWLAKSHHDETELRVRFRLPAGAAWDGGLWIDEDRRVGRAFPALWAGVKGWLEAEGLTRTISSIADYNAASIAAHRRMGAQPIGHVGVVRIGSVQWSVFRGAAGRGSAVRDTAGANRRHRLSRTRWPEFVLEG